MCLIIGWLWVGVSVRGVIRVWLTISWARMQFCTTCIKGVGEILHHQQMAMFVDSLNEKEDANANH